MRHYEVTFIVNPVLSGDEVKSAASHVQTELTDRWGCQIVHVDEMGLRQLAYPIQKRSSGVYYCIEFATEGADFLTKFELNLKRDERLLRFLTVRLDKFGIKYNDDKRNGRIGSKHRAKMTQAADAEKVSAPEVVDLDAAEAAA